MPKVFIPQLPTRFDKATGQRIPTIDTNPAAKFGELVQMFGPDVPKGKALAALSSADGAPAIGPGDSVLAVGDVALLAVVLVKAIERNGRATLLRWDSESKTYRPEEVRA